MDIMSDDSAKSFHTAAEGQDAPSILHTSHTSHRRVQRIPYELRDHIRVFLEERMYGEAVQLLTSLLASGGSNQQYGAQPDAVSPLWIPPPSHLAVLATLAVHPAYTSRPQDGNDLRVAGHALQYLRHILTVAGPVQADMATAFQFRDAQGRPVGRPRPARNANGNASGSGDAALSRRNSGRSVRAGRLDSGNAALSTGASAPASRAQSARPRRSLFAQSARTSLHGGIASEYVDSGSIPFGDEDDVAGTDGQQRDDLVRAVHAAANKMAVDGDGDNNDSTTAFADDDDEAVGGRMATKDSVWARGQDFWHIVAWAMACSVNEPARWQCWQPWLALIVDVLEADFAQRLERDGDRNGDTDLIGSLLFQYLIGSSSGASNTTQLRRIAQAILADGTQPPALVREVFDKETVAANPQSAAAAQAANAAKPARTLDLDNDKFGDYSDDDESAPPTPDSARSMSPTPFSRNSGKPQKPKPNQKLRNTGSSDGLNNNTGFLESIPLRQRLLYLVMLASVYLPSDFAPTDTVYRAVAEVLRDGDIHVFSSIALAPLTPMPDALASAALPDDVDAASVPKPDDAFAGLLSHILFTYLPASAPKPSAVDPRACQATAPSVQSVSSRILQRCFLPFAANTAMLGANVRMALTLEGLFRLAWGAGSGSDAGSVIWTPALQAAAEAGVKAREARVQTSGRNKHYATDAEALGKYMLQRSGKRLLAMVHLAEMDVAV